MADITPYVAPSNNLPSPVGNSGKFLATDGTNVSWQTVVAIQGFPLQGGNAGKYLRTDGTTPYWDSVSGGSGGGGGNTVSLDSISSQFNGNTTIFPLLLSGNKFYPLSSSNILVVLGGVTQQPNVDYVVSGYNVVFSTPPSAGLTCFILSLGGLGVTSSPTGVVSTDNIWTSVGQLAVSTASGVASVLPIGSNGQVLTVVSGTTLGMQWQYALPQNGSSGQVLTVTSGNTYTWQTPSTAAGVPTGSIFYFAANTAPTGYLTCNGASLSTSTYSSLFSAIRYSFGGSGGSFSLPDLRDRFLTGLGYSYSLGSTGGASTVMLDLTQIPPHQHTFTGGINTVGATYPTYLSSDASITQYVTPVGGGQPHENRPPYIALLPCIKY